MGREGKRGKERMGEKHSPPKIFLVKSLPCCSQSQFVAVEFANVVKCSDRLDLVCRICSLMLSSYDRAVLLFFFFV